MFTSKMPLSISFFGSATQDERLEELNLEFWRSLLRHVSAECSAAEVRTILDVGCHRGGMLELFAQQLHPERIVGIEPIAAARRHALMRLRTRAPDVQILDTTDWHRVSAASVDIALSHEMLYLIADIPMLMNHLAHVLRPGGRAFVVFGCHTENPLWARWKQEIAKFGHETFDHSPLDVLRCAAAAGMHTSVRPLRRDGWVIHDPMTATDTYATVSEMFDHHYRHKLCFRLVRPREDGKP